MSETRAHAATPARPPPVHSAQASMAVALLVWRGGGPHCFLCRCSTLTLANVSHTAQAYVDVVNRGQMPAILSTWQVCAAANACMAVVCVPHPRPPQSSPHGPASSARGKCVLLPARACVTSVHVPAYPPPLANPFHTHT
eukprot:77586-Chlamydomonas_euryale.AAC.2